MHFWNVCIWPRRVYDGRIFKIFGNVRNCPKIPIILVVSVRFKQWFRTFSLACFAKIFGTFSGFRKGTPVDKKNRHENVPKYSVFYFRDRRYNFAKLYRSSKALPKRMALM